MPESKGVEAVERALSILDCFGPDAARLSLAEIAARTGLYKSTILRLAVSLERFGYLSRGEDGRFGLASAVWRLGAAYRSGFELSDVLRPELKILSDRTLETASYYVREGDSRICLFRSEPERSIRHALLEGARMPVGQGASGKVLSAWTEPFSEEGGGIRAAGYAVSLGERDPEVAAVAVPVLSRQGICLGALSVSGLVTRFGPDRVPALLDALRESQASLAARIGN